MLNAGGGDPLTEASCLLSTLSCTRAEIHGDDMEESLCRYFPSKQVHIVEHPPNENDEPSLAVILHNLNLKFAEYMERI